MMSTTPFKNDRYAVLVVCQLCELRTKSDSYLLLEIFKQYFPSSIIFKFKTYSTSS